MAINNSPFRMTLTVAGVKQLDFAMAGVTRGIQNVIGLTGHRIVDFIESRIERPQFASRGVRGASGLWAPYKHTYGPNKLKGEPASLRKTDELYGSLTGRSDLTVEVIEPMRLQFGTRHQGAYWLQTGTRKMAARPIFSFQPEDNRAVSNTITAEIRNIARRLGFRILGQAGRDVSSSEALSTGLAALAGGEGAPVSSYL